MEIVLNAVTWFEIPVVDFDRAKHFYSAIFNYEMPDVMTGSKRMGFFLCSYNEGGVGGAIVKADGFEPSNTGSKIYLNGGDDLSTVLGRVEDAGGKIILPKEYVNREVGFVASFEDPEGNEVYLHSRS